MDRSEVALLEVGDRRRAAVGGPAVAALACATAFLVFAWVTKEVPALYAAEPWRDDPYDALVSFSFGAIPLLVAAAAVRLHLCRRFEPLPSRRLLDLFALSRAAMVVVAAVVAAEWVSVAIAARTVEPTGVSLLLLLALGGFSLLTMAVLRSLDRAGREVPVAAPQPDLLADCVTATTRLLHRVDRRGGTTRVVRVVDDAVVGRMREHPLATCASLATGVSLVFAAPKVAIEHYRPTLVAFVLVVVWCSFFSFLVLVGARLGLVARRRAVPRRHVLALIAASTAVPLAATFRSSLWWAIGTSEDRATLTSFVVLCAAGAALAATVALVAPSLRRAR